MNTAALLDKPAAVPVTGPLTFLAMSDPERERETGADATTESLALVPVGDAVAEDGTDGTDDGDGEGGKKRSWGPGTAGGKYNGTDAKRRRGNNIPTPDLRGAVMDLIWKATDEQPPAGKFYQAELARQMGWPPQYLSQYLNWNGNLPLRWNVPEYEGKAQAFLSRLDRTNEAELQQVEETAATVDLIEFCHGLAEQGMCGVYTSDAGSGKDMGIMRLMTENPLTICITASAACCTMGDIAKAIFKKLGMRHGSSPDRDATRVMERMARAPRQIVINNAQRLRRAALAFLFDCFDLGEGKSPRMTVVFVGNEEIEEKIIKSGQLARRIGRVRNGNLVWRKKGAMENACRAMLRLHLPEYEGELLKYCVAVANADDGGRLGAVVRRLQETRRVLATSRYAGKPVQAFCDAHATLYQKNKVDLRAPKE